jgi:superfamily II DNA/RNA helicase
MMPLKIDLRSVRVAHGDYNVNDLDSAIMPYLEAAAQAVVDHASDRKTLVFLPLVRTSQTFVQICRDKGINAVHIDGESPDRKEILDDFHKNKYSLLSNSSLLLEGYDCPDIDCIMCLRPTQSRPLYQQMVGRGTRISPGKENLLLLDFLWLTEQHSLCVPASLFAKTKQEAKEVMDYAAKKSNGWDDDSEFDLVQMVADTKKEREDSLAKKLRDSAKVKKSRLVNPIEFALSIHDDDLYTYEPVMPWEFLEVTEKQKATLDKLGIDSVSVQWRGQASRILNTVFSRRKFGLCTVKQANLLRKFGVDPQNLAMDEASKIIGERLSVNNHAVGRVSTNTNTGG